jgi:D-sedoheptulose 7-phosphate isomerase
MNGEQIIYQDFIEKYPKLADMPVKRALDILSTCYESGSKILVCGNGGSASDAEHIVGELMKGFRLKRQLSKKDKKSFAAVNGGERLADSLQKGIPAISLNSHLALLTAVGNDVDYQMVFAQQVYGYGKPGDVLIAMSTSGQSKNIVEAAKTASVLGIKVLGITGNVESELEKYCDICFRMPTKETYQVQEYTLPLYHTLCAMLEERIFG